LGQINGSAPKKRSNVPLISGWTTAMVALSGIPSMTRRGRMANGMASWRLGFLIGVFEVGIT
jgi:hypothetical protein